jgi:indolepyruvate ferredoxin oxidoreductase, beta subunit
MLKDRSIFPKDKMNFLLVGVGGQGTILASNVLAEVGLKLGYDTKQAEIHGMSQRGGSVTSHIRWSPQVFSPIIPHGGADVLVAFEKLEAARYIDFLSPDGLVLINDYSISPVTVNVGQAVYPDDQTLRNLLKPFTEKVYWIKGLALAEKVGNSKTANVVMLGALCALLRMPPEPWIQVLGNWVPQKLLEINQVAFNAGHGSILR